MKRKNLNLIIVLAVMCSLVFIQGAFGVRGNASAERLPNEFLPRMSCGLTKDEILSRLSYGMTPAEVEEALGKPSVPIITGRYIPIYYSSEGIRIELYFEDENYNLSGAYSEDGIDLLADSWKAEKANFDLRVDNEEIVSGNPIVTINGKTYIPLKEFEEYLGIEVEWNEDGRVEIVTDKADDENDRAEVGHKS